MQIRGYPIRFDLDLMILFSANPATYKPERKGHSAVEGPYRQLDSDPLSPRSRFGIEILQQEAGMNLDGEYPVQVPYFMTKSLRRSRLKPGRVSTSIKHRESPPDSRWPTIEQ